MIEPTEEVKRQQAKAMPQGGACIAVLAVSMIFVWGVMGGWMINEYIITPHNYHAIQEVME